jgi:hypothetical protein
MYFSKNIDLRMIYFLLQHQFFKKKKYVLKFYNDQIKTIICNRLHIFYFCAGKVGVLPSAQIWKKYSIN